MSPKRPLYINLGPVRRPADRLFGIPHVRWYRAVGLLPADTMGDLLGGSTGAQSYHSPTKLAQGSGRPLQLTSTSGPPDGRSTGCLASHTSGCTVRLLHCRSIDERTRWATFSADLLSGQSTSRDQLAGIRATVMPVCDPQSGRSTGCLASHTSGDTIRCLHSRPWSMNGRGRTTYAADPDARRTGSHRVEV